MLNVGKDIVMFGLFGLHFSFSLSLSLSLSLSFQIFVMIIVHKKVASQQLLGVVVYDRGAYFFDS